MKPPFSMPSPVLLTVACWAILGGCAGQNGSALSNPNNRLSPSAGGGSTNASNAAPLVPYLTTEQVNHEPVAAAFWSSSDGATRLIGLDSGPETGALTLFDTDGKALQKVDGLRRPVSLDVQPGVRVASTEHDIVAVAEGESNTVHFYSIDEKGLRQIGDAKLSLESGLGQIALYKRADGTTFLFATPSQAVSSGLIHQFEVLLTEKGVELKRVRTFGSSSGPTDDNSITGLLVDDDLNALYVIESTKGVHKYHADPVATDADKPLATFAGSGLSGKRSGIALFPTTSGKGYIALVEQKTAASEIRLYVREGSQDKPHDHQEAGIVRTASDLTVGLGATGVAFGTTASSGVLALTNRSGQTFHVYDWNHLSRLLKPKRSGRTEPAPRTGE